MTQSEIVFAEEGLDDSQAADLMRRLVAAATA
jgi:hypothetical protein